MTDADARALDKAILKFITRHSRCEGPAPEGEFEDLAMCIFRYQFRHNLHYRRYCEIQRKRPESVFSWKDIPSMPAAGFRELVLATFPIQRAVKTFRTSGTTQEVRGAHFFETTKLYDASIAPPFRRYLLPDGARPGMFFLVPSAKEAPDSSLSYMMRRVEREFGRGRGGYYVSQAEIHYEKLWRDLARAKGRVMLLATAFSLKAFLDWMARGRKKLRLPEGSRLMETGGFKGRVRAVPRHELYEDCGLRLGIDKHFCVSEYGMTELSSQYYDSTLADHHDGLRRKALKVGPPWVRAVVVDPRTGHEAKKGSPGLLRHVDLANRASVVSVQTEDLGRAFEHGFEIFGRAKGAELRGCSLAYEEFIRGSEERHARS